MEPIYAPHPHQKGQGWILTVVFDGNQDQSTVQIFSAEQLDAGSIAVLELPEVIPFGFHGTWQSALMLS
jgi:carotenoid cleavage dioxygenase-like enzyme